MANPMEFAASSADEVKYIETLFSDINREALIKGFESITSAGTNKMKLLWGGKSATLARGSITIRFTPELHKQWLSMIGETSISKAANPTDIKQRASGEFATAFKDGKLIIEVKQDGKRTLYASKETAANMSTGNLKLAKKNGEEADYTLKIIDRDGFAAIANSFMTNMQAAQAPVATLSSEAIAATATDPNLALAPIDTAQAQAMVQKTAEKRTTSSLSKKPTNSKDVEESESLQAQEKALQAERDKQEVELAKKKEHKRAEITTEAQELRQEEIKQEELKVETTKTDTKVLDAIKAEEESPLEPGETVP